MMKNKNFCFQITIQKKKIATNLLIQNKKLKIKKMFNVKKILKIVINIKNKVKFCSNHKIVNKIVGKMYHKDQKINLKM